jgi:hypothetical protein
MQGFSGWILLDRFLLGVLRLLVLILSLNLGSIACLRTFHSFNLCLQLLIVLLHHVQLSLEQLLLILQLP